MKYNFDQPVLLAVVIPAYNVGDYIKKSVLSLESWLNNSSVSILIINDGSTDDTLGVALELQQKYSNVTVVSQQNSGLSKTRNRGLELTNSKFVYFFDGDDYMDGQLNDKILQIIDNDVADIVCLGYSKVDSNGNEISQHLFNKSQPTSLLTRKQFVASVVSDDKEPIAGYLPTKIVSRSLIGNTKFRDMNYEDMPFVMEMLAAGQSDRFLYLNRSIYKYVQRNASITHTVSVDNLSDKLLGLSIVQKCLLKMRLSQKVIEKNNRRSFIVALWVSSINSRSVHSSLVGKMCNRVLKNLFFARGRSYKGKFYQSLKGLMYLVLNKLQFA